MGWCGAEAGRVERSGGKSWMKRSEVIEFLPNPEGGITVFDEGRYFAELNAIVMVRYDEAGGQHSLENRATESAEVIIQNGFCDKACR